MPQVFIRPDVEKAIKDKVKDIIKRHQGSVMGEYFEYTSLFGIEKENHLIPFKN